MPYAYRRASGQLIRRRATDPAPGELVVHTGKRPRTSRRRPVVLDANNKPLRTPLILHKGKRAS